MQISATLRKLILDLTHMGRTVEIDVNGTVRVMPVDNTKITVSSDPFDLVDMRRG